MATTNNAPGVEDLASVGTRISWGAILAGTMVALGMYIFLLSTLAAAVGLSISDRVDPTKLEMGAVVWALLTTIAALFLGGLVTSLFTAGENKTEAMLYGAIMWATLVVVLLFLGSVGVHTGFNAMAAAASSARTTITADTGNAERDAETRRATQEAATRISWYAFAGTWISMLAAVGGALVGAGPTFRVVNLTPTQRVVVSS